MKVSIITLLSLAAAATAIPLSFNDILDARGDTIPVKSVPGGGVTPFKRGVDARDPGDTIPVKSVPGGGVTPFKEKRDAAAEPGDTIPVKSVPGGGVTLFKEKRFVVTPDTPSFPGIGVIGARDAHADAEPGDTIPVKSVPGGGVTPFKKERRELPSAWHQARSVPYFAEAETAWILNGRTKS